MKKNTTKPTPISIPKGGMCVGCTHLLENCSHLPFSEYRRIGKVDSEGYVEVKCEEYDKVIITESLTGDGK